ncbi:MAG: hypothetical protein ACK5SX_15340 [Sandaracinobacter sp.]
MIHFPRRRDFKDAFGDCLSISTEAHGDHLLVELDRPDVVGQLPVRLDAYGAELLCGYLLSAGRAFPRRLGDELIDGGFPARLRVVPEPCSAVRIQPLACTECLDIPFAAWDWVSAEMSLVVAAALQRLKAAGTHLR